MEVEIFRIIPNNFRELMAGFFLVISIFPIFLNYFKDFREISLKISGVLIVLSVMLFANDSTCYLIGIVILATLVTNLDFLENILAIIGKSDAYFKHKVEMKFRSRDDINSSLEEETLELENALLEECIPEDVTSNPPSLVDTDNSEKTSEDVAKQSFNESVHKEHISEILTRAYSRNDRIKFAYLVEECVLKFLEARYQQSINRHVSFSHNEISSEFDGFMALKDRDIIFEIKVSRVGEYPKELLRKSIINSLHKIEEVFIAYNRPITLQYVLVGNFTFASKLRISKVVSELSNSTRFNRNVDLAIEFYTFNEVGVDLDIEV